MGNIKQQFPETLQCTFPRLAFSMGAGYSWIVYSWMDGGAVAQWLVRCTSGPSCSKDE